MCAQAYKLTKEPFWTSQSNLKLDALGSATLQLQLVAVHPGSFGCELNLLNEDVGEFCVEAKAKVGMPKAMEPMKFSVEATEDAVTVTKLLKLPAANFLLDKALAALIERLPTSDRSSTKQGMLAIQKGASVC